MIASQQESYDKLRQCVKKQKHHSADKGLYRQGCGLASGHWQLGELYCKESRVPDNWCLQTVMLEKTPESRLDSKIKPINFKGTQPWILIERTDPEPETAVFWSSDVNRGLIGKVPDAGKDWGQKRESEDEMAWWHYQCNGHEFGQALGDGEGQGGVEFCSLWSHRELDTTGWLNKQLC